MSAATDDRISPEEAAELTQLSLDRLKQLRYERRIYPFYKVPGTRAVYYKRSEVEAIIDAGRVEVRS
jgi:predicted HTH domain antitoxin